MSWYNWASGKMFGSLVRVLGVFGYLEVLGWIRYYFEVFGNIQEVGRSIWCMRGYLFTGLNFSSRLFRLHMVVMDARVSIYIYTYIHTYIHTYVFVWTYRFFQSCGLILRRNNPVSIFASIPRHRRLVSLSLYLSLSLYIYIYSSLLLSSLSLSLSCPLSLSLSHVTF